MTTNTRAVTPADATATQAPAAPGAGLRPDELEAEQAGDLPGREAMSILSVGGLEGGLPSGALDDLQGADVPLDTLPVTGLPVEQYPVDQLPPIDGPITQLPVDRLPVDTLPIEDPLDGESIGIPEGAAADADSSLKA